MFVTVYGYICNYFSNTTYWSVTCNIRRTRFDVPCLACCV